MSCHYTLLLPYGKVLLQGRLLLRTREEPPWVGAVCASARDSSEGWRKGGKASSSPLCFQALRLRIWAEVCVPGPQS